MMLPYLSAVVANRAGVARDGRRRWTVRCWQRLLLQALAAAAMWLALAAGLRAQSVGPPVLPGTDPRPPALAAPPAGPAPLQMPQPPLPPAAAGGAPRFVLRDVRVVGNTVIPAAQLEQLVAPYRGRAVTQEDLAALRQALTQRYVEAGYINSGALLPDQQVVDGVVEYRIVEGRLSAIEVTGTGHLHEDYVAQRLALAGAAPLNVNRLQDRLQILLQGPFIERINGELSPGDRPGEARLRVKITEGPRSAFSAALDNDMSPSLGDARLTLRGQWFSPSGRGDILGWELAHAAGFRKAGLSYGVPIRADDTTLDVFAETSSAQVVETPLNALDIQSRSRTAGLRLSHPWLRSARERLSLSVGLDLRQSRSELLGAGFAFSPGVEPDGRSRVSVIRLVQDYVGRDSAQVTAARSTVSIGVAAFGATDQGAGLPSGKFIAWLGQFQHARRLGNTDTQLVARVDAQLSSRALLPLEQFSVGGMRTVRGFRTNQLVRDQGYAASAELRIPVLRAADGAALLQVAPFIDLGGAWFKGRANAAPSRLSSAGVGLRYDPARALHAELYYAHTFAGRNVVNPSRSLQDRGWHLMVQATF